MIIMYVHQIHVLHLHEHPNRCHISYKVDHDGAAWCFKTRPGRVHAWCCGHLVNVPELEGDAVVYLVSRKHELYTAGRAHHICHFNMLVLMSNVVMVAHV